jgi:hypothetical protein
MTTGHAILHRDKRIELARALQHHLWREPGVVKIEHAQQSIFSLQREIAATRSREARIERTWLSPAARGAENAAMCGAALCESPAH